MKFPTASRLIRTTLITLASLLLLTPAAFAQLGEEWQWNSPLGFEPDQPLIIEPVEGTETYAVFQVLIPGFWSRERIGDDQRTYTELRFPGLGSTLQKGAPNLPVLGLDLAVPTNAEQISLAEIQEGDTFAYEMLVYPRTIPERDHEEGDPEVFLFDERIYGGQEPFPLERGLPVPVMQEGPIPHGRFEYSPCVWYPAENRLEFTPEFVVVCEFPGDVVRREPGTLEMDRFAASLFENWRFVEANFPPNAREFEANYLFVYPEDFRAEIEPLIDQKKARGYQVSEVTIESTTGTCSGIRAAILNWHTSIPYWRDRYCLLVGDVDRIPLCDSPALEWDEDETAPTDDLYASPGGDDLFEEVYLGRISFDSATDLDRQITKILDYEDHASPLVDFTRCGLVAHREDAPGKYEGAHESVRTATYAVTPSFETFYGSAGATDADVIDFVNSEVGIVAYRGHGSSSSWTSWNTSIQYFNNSDLGTLSNGTATPVIWSFACNNAELGVNDCLGEHWLELEEGGAVAHYGATIPSYTVQNHELDRAMFRAVWDYGLVTQSHAIRSAEYEMGAAEGTDNAWMYLLLGDPDMKIRRNAPPAWTLIVPELIPTCTIGPCDLEIQVYDQFERPLERVLVSAWKPSAGKAGDDVFVNGYTDGGGQVVLPVEPDSEGTLDLVVRDLDGNVFTFGIPVRSGATSLPLSGLEPLRLSAAPSVTSAGTTFRFSRPLDRDATIDVYDIRGRLVRTLDLGASSTSAAWDGRDSAGRSLSSGVYYARTRDEGRVTTTRVTLIR